MNLEAIISWNPDMEFENASVIDILLSMGPSKTFQGQLKRPNIVIDYLNTLAFYASDMEQTENIKPIREEKGRRTYEIPIVASGCALDDLELMAKRIQMKHYLVTRDAWVTDEEYCTFFGSSGNLWNIKKCDYPQGDFAETIRQTVYDMEHGNPRIYSWTNVPNIWGLEHRMKSEPRLEGFVKKIKPLVYAFGHSDALRNQNYEGIKKQLNQLADLAERYKKEHGLNRL